MSDLKKTQKKSSMNSQNNVVTKILFVCTGNICRSPTAQYILMHKLDLLGKSKQFVIESRGTSSFHNGEKADSRAISTLTSHGINMNSHIAHGINPDDLLKFDIIYCMSIEHVSQLKSLARVLSHSEQFASGLSSINLIESKIKLFLRECRVSSGIVNVVDPYDELTDKFEYVYNLLDEACDSFIKNIDAKTI